MNTRTIVVADFVLFATTFLSKSSIYARHRAASPPRITLHLRRSLVNARTTRMLSTNFLRVRLRCRGVFSNPCIPLRSRRNGLRGMKNPQPNGREILLPRCHSSFFRKGGRLLRLCPGECRHDASVASFSLLPHIRLRLATIRVWGFCFITALRSRLWRVPSLRHNFGA